MPRIQADLGPLPPSTLVERQAPLTAPVAFMSADGAAPCSLRFAWG